MEGKPEPGEKIDWDKVELEPLEPREPKEAAAAQPIVEAETAVPMPTQTAPAFSPEDEKLLAAADHALKGLAMDFTHEAIHKERIQNLMDLKLPYELKREAYRRMYLNGLRRGSGYGNIYGWIEKNLKDHPNLFVPLSAEVASSEEEHKAALEGIKIVLQSRGDMRQVKNFMVGCDIGAEEVRSLGVVLTPKSIEWAIVLPYGYEEDIFQKLKEIFDLLQTPGEEANKLVKEAVMRLPGNYRDIPENREFIEGLKENYGFTDSDAEEYVARYIKNYYFTGGGYDRPPLPRRSEVETKINQFGVKPASILMREEFRKAEFASEHR